MNLPGVDAKIVVLGDTGVGKTCLVSRYTSGTFVKSAVPTIGAAFLTKKFVLDQHRVNLQIWDTAGQERFRSMAPMYYRGAAAAVLAYDVTDEKTFRSVKRWILELKRNVSDPMVLAIAGNKVDLPGRVVSADTAAEYAEEVGAISCDTSAATGKGIDEMFTAISKRLIESHLSGGESSQPGSSYNTPVDLRFSKEKPGKEGCGC